MKRIGYIYEKIYDKENIKNAIYKAAKGKTVKRNVAHVLENIDDYINRVHEMLKTETYKLSNNHIKIIKDGPRKKERTITIPAFYPDQIIHWALMLQIQPIISKGMYYYNCGSIPNKGAIFAKKYVEQVLKEKPKYALKLDIKKFFPSVSNNKLKYLFTKKIKDQKVLNLINAIIDNGGKGLPIGYYTSQWFSNFYLEELDHFIKELIKIEYYVRYVDDMVLFSNNKRKLHQAKSMIEEFLIGYEFNLRIKENWQVFRIDKRHIDFVGYMISSEKTKLRKHIFYKMHTKAKKLETKISLNNAQSLISLLGWMMHTTYGSQYIDKRINNKISINKLKDYIGRIKKHENISKCSRSIGTSTSCYQR